MPPLERNDALRLTDKWRYCRREDGAALNDESHPGSHHDGDITGDPTEREREVCPDHMKDTTQPTFIGRDDK